MKFFCERCKTRYSIGDDRVRGKILKIRCKNCANVITVREGMSVDDEPLPRGRSTTMAPAPTEQAPAERPPDALEEEWYVSIDGVQSGPYPLTEAQRWIAEKPHSADLHCWNEGFDDWLPVDRVSHFRGLRRPPLATPPPAPMPPRPPPPRPPPMPAANGSATKELALGAAPIAAHTPRRLGTDAFDTPPDPPAVLGDGDPFAELRTPAPAPAAAPSPPPELEDDLNIGEVSRVVNLADLARAAAASDAKKKAAAPAPAASPSAPFAPFAPAPAARDPLDATSSIDALPPVPERAAPAPMAQAQRRGWLLLVSAAAAVLVGVTVALVLTLGHDSDDDDGDTAAIQPVAHAIDTARPDQVIPDHVVVAPPVAGSNAQPHPVIRRPQIATQPQSGQPAHPETAEPDRLKPEEIEKMAQDNSTGTTRCYMRAQRGVDGIELGDVKKIMVTLTIDKSGVVTDVRLSDHSTDTLGVCLTGQIRRWRFRETAGGGGPFQFALAFAGS